MTHPQNGSLTSEQVRKRQGHPTLDGDGHILEYTHILHDYFRQVAGADALAALRKWDASEEVHRWTGLDPVQRRHRRIGRPQWWASSGNSRDRATAALPALRRARMDELGIDFAVLYGSAALALVVLPNDDLRAPMCRAYNTMVADLYREHADRMTPTAIIPMHTPEEAIAELDHAIKKLGLKAIMMANFIERVIPVADKAPEEIRRAATYFDMLALDSPFDYDPVWAKCVELRVVPTAHNTTYGLGFRRSLTNFMYNHCGHFAAGAELFAKAVFFGGVTRRFPQLNFCFQEGGASWGANLFAGLVSRWEKRNGSGIHRYDPAQIDSSLVQELFDRYAGDIIKSRSGPNDPVIPPFRDGGMTSANVNDIAYLDEFAACGIERAEDVVSRFAEPFYFGCEADDPFAGAAIKGTGMPFSTKIKAVFGSDMGHWDIVDMREVLAEAYELVEHGMMDEAEYRDFVFGNTARMYTRNNPDFFKGTVVEDDVARFLAGDRRVA